jgi:hypothetical protein
MGNLSSIPIREYRINFGLTCFVETGTAGGGGVDTGIRAGFTNLLSCEIDKKYYEETINRFKGMRGVKIFYGASVNVLPCMLSLCANSNILFWLDAHLPINEQKLKSSLVFPLESEIEVIKSIRDISEDVFIIDDLVLYDRSLRSESFDLSRYTNKKEDSLINKETLCGYFDSHEIIENCVSDGFLICLPKKESNVTRNTN